MLIIDSPSTENAPSKSVWPLTVRLFLRVVAPSTSNTLLISVLPSISTVEFIVTAPSTFNVLSKSPVPCTFKLDCNVALPPNCIVLLNIAGPSRLSDESKSTEPVAWRVPVISNVDVGLLFWTPTLVIL